MVAIPQGTSRCYFVPKFETSSEIGLIHFGHHGSLDMALLPRNFNELERRFDSRCADHFAEYFLRQRYSPLTRTTMATTSSTAHMIFNGSPP